MRRRRFTSFNLRTRAVTHAFTLLETMIALVIIGVGILAFVEAQSAFIKSNSWSNRAATGMLLANEIREMTRAMPRHDSVTGLTHSTNNGVASVIGWGAEAGEITVDDIDDIDDLDGLTFGEGGDFSGPINAFGEVVPAVDINGQPVMSNGQVRSLIGWTQSVTVEKVDPFDSSLVRADSYVRIANGTYNALAVDQFPLRVTVVVSYAEVGASPMEIARLSWIVPVLN